MFDSDSGAHWALSAGESESELIFALGDANVPSTKEAYELRAEMTDQGVIFCYNGCLSEEILTSLGDPVKQMLSHVIGEKKTCRALFHMFVEQAQNIIRYSADVLSDPQENEADLRQGFLAIGQSNGRYYACSANQVASENVARLSENLDRLKSLDEGEFKELYKTTLRGEIPEGSKGAGVGFIEMARRATGGFNFEFQQNDDGQTYFSYSAHI